MDIRCDSRKKINGQCGKGWREGPNGKCIRNAHGDLSGSLHNLGKEGLLKAALKDTVFGEYGASEYRRRRSAGQSRGRAALAGTGYNAKSMVQSAIFTPLGARVYQGSRDVGQSRKQAAKKGFATGAALVAGIAIKNKLGQKKTEAKANAEKMKGVVDVKATRVDSSDDAKCDRKAGWVRGPGGKCVRKKKNSVKRDLATLGLVGAAGLVGSRYMSKKVAGIMSRERSKPGHNTVYVMPDNAVARARRQAGTIDVTATRVDAEYALGYLAGKGIEYSGNSPAGYLCSYLHSRNDAANAKCDKDAGWERGPGGKCVRRKNGRRLAMSAFAGGAAATGLALAGGGALAYKNREKIGEAVAKRARKEIAKVAVEVGKEAAKQGAESAKESIKGELNKAGKKIGEGVESAKKAAEQGLESVKFKAGAARHAATEGIEKARQRVASVGRRFGLRKDSLTDPEYALGYLAGKGVEYHGDNPVGYLHGFLQFREDSPTRAQCDPSA